MPNQLEVNVGILTDQQISAVANTVRLAARDFILKLDLPQQEDKTKNFFSKSDLVDLAKKYPDESSKMVEAALRKWRDGANGTAAELCEALDAGGHSELAQSVF